MKGMDRLEFHRARYAEEFVFDELRWSRIRPCPNIASLTSRLRMLFGKGPKFYASALGWEFGGHIRIFTSGTLRRLLEENGFAVDEMAANLVSFIPTWSTRRPWSVALGGRMPGLGEVLIVKARRRIGVPLHPDSVKVV